MHGKTTFLLITVLSAGCTLLAQKKTYQLMADSVRIFSSCDTAELILENRTRTIPNGVLTNKGNGVTEFRKVLVRLEDSLYTIGGDTLNMATAARNIYNSNGRLTDNRVVDGNHNSIRFENNENYTISNNQLPVIISRTPMDSLLTDKIVHSDHAPFAGLAVRGTGCDAAIELVSDSAGTCFESQQIDFTTLKPRRDSWLTPMPDSYGDKYLLGRMELQTNRQMADYATIGFGVKSDTAYFSDGAYIPLPAGYPGGYMPLPVMSINPSFKHPQGYFTKMPFVRVNGGLFVGYLRNWYFNSRNAADIISGVDDVAGYLQPFYETRFSVYADSLPLKIYKLPAIKGNAFLTYSPTRTVEGNNVAFEYKDSIYEDIRNYMLAKGLGIASDRNLKENIRDARFDMSTLLSLPVKEFNYKSDSCKIAYTGLIAQDLKPALPGLVTGQEGNYRIDYIKMVPYLLMAIQDQQKQILQLSRQVDACRPMAETTLASPRIGDDKLRP